MRIKELFSINKTHTHKKKLVHHTACKLDRERAHPCNRKIRQRWILQSFLTDVMMKKCRQRRTNFGGSRRQ
jgi:hypothetical protein